MRILSLSAFAFLTLVQPLAGAEPQETADKLEDAFRGWMDQLAIEAGSIAVTYKGDLVRRVGIGRDADAPVELASVSKSITALCALSLIEDGIWTASTTVADIMGADPERGAAEVTIGQLMSHSSGYDTDLTQTMMPEMIDQPDHAGTTKQSFAAGPQSPAGTYIYTNENYDMLGALIETQTNAPYATECAERVLVPAGVTARPSPRTGAFAAFGGWAMSVADYAKIHATYYGPDTALGAAPETFPNVEIGGGARYGVGMVWRPFQDGHNFWHFGAICIADDLNVGSFTVQWDGGWAVTAAYDACVAWPAMAALDNALAGAVFGGR